MNKISLTWLVLLTSMMCQAQASAATNLKPGDKIAEAVERAAENTTFHLSPGVYRMQYARPKNGQKFIGKGDVVFNGALILANWRQVDGFWTAVGPEVWREPSGACRKETPLCSHREDLFVDGKLYKKVASLAEVAAGKWYEDKVNIYISDDPNDKLVELGVMPFAFASEAEGVQLQNITVEKYATPAQRGAIEFLRGKNWQLRNVVSRWNHGVGVRFGSGARISGGSFSHNGQLGMGGGYGSGIVIENVEIAHNNYAGYNEGWEAGGTKFVKADGLVVRNACVHNNDGPGLWTDIDNINIEYADNLVFDNQDDGIKHEISYGAKIHGNTVARNGHERLNWLWGSQILIQNSQDVEVYNNIVEVGAKFGNGISVINQERGEGSFGPWLGRNNSVHGNTIIHLAPKGFNGMIADHGREWFDEKSGNFFDANTYVVPANNRPYFIVKDQGKRFAELPDFGMERKAKVTVETREPLKLKCPR